MIHQILKRILGLFGSKHLTELNLNLSAEEINDRAHQYYADGNFTEAFKYFKFAADKGNLNAQFNLGIMYVNGLGGIQDYSEAIRYLKLAADQGDLESLYRIGAI
jgi:TPR repeat protein